MRNWLTDFKIPQKDNDTWYDLISDYPLIEASFLEQYGIRLSETEMSWLEFSDLVSCLSADTALGRIVAIRSENDVEVLKTFTAAQKEIRNEWRSQQDAARTQADYEKSMQELLYMALA